MSGEPWRWRIQVDAIKCGEETRLGKVVALPFRDDSSVEPGNGQHLLQTSDF